MGTSPSAGTGLRSWQKWVPGSWEQINIQVSLFGQQEKQNLCMASAPFQSSIMSLAAVQLAQELSNSEHTPFSW